MRACVYVCFSIYRENKRMLNESGKDSATLHAGKVKYITQSNMVLHS